VAVLFVVVYFSRRTYAGFGYWVAWQICSLTGFVVFANRGPEPGPYSILLTNLFLLTAPALLCHGFIRFHDLRSGRLLILTNYLPVALALAAQFHFTFVVPDQQSRIVVFSLARMAVLIRCCVELLRSREMRTSPSFFLFAAILLVLIANDLFQIWRIWQPAAEIDSWGGANIKFALLVGIAGDILGAYGLLLLIRERLERELDAARHNIEALARTDALTGIWNRRHLDEIVGLEVERARRYRQPVSLILLDVDHFKSINDRYGHAAGDDVLRQIAALGRHSIRSTDTIGRWGGEEFLILAPGTPLANAGHMADKLRRAIADHAFAAPGRVTASIGVAEWGIGDDIDSWMRRADAALYLAKQSGRNRVETAEIGEHDQAIVNQA
jgi:diguanylate cyclase (GGDEF)-like protein